MKFIHYGCWNNIDCKYNYRDIVIEYIKKFENNYEFLIISGDNWYTNKYDDDDLRSYKMYFTNVLRSGLIKLYALNKDCHIILGNHDEDVDDDYSKLKEDCMLNIEEYNIRLINNNLLLPATISLEELQNQKYIRYLMQESIKYTKSSHLSDHKLILHKCKEEIDYIYANDILIIFTNTNILSGESFEYIYAYINTMLEILENHHRIAKHIFIVGHEPITSLKWKKNQYSPTKLQNDKDVFKYFVDSIKKYKPVYLCADTHNFQFSSIDNSIYQIVTGTGGASEDHLQDTDDNVIEYRVLVYNVKGHYHNSYGYSVIETIENGIIVTYKHIIDNNNQAVSREYKYTLQYSNGSYNLSISNSDNKAVINYIAQTVNEEMKDLCTHLSTENTVQSIKDKKIFCYKKKAK
jgi:hypothetical protein